MTVALDIVSRALKDIGALEAGETPSADSAQDSGNVFALTSNSQISATTLINDVDPYTQTITNWRKTNTLTGYYFNGTKVVGAQQGAIANSGNATTDAILAALRTQGLIAT